MQSPTPIFSGGGYYRENIFITCSYNTLFHFAVPCFVMLSGAFLLANEKNGDSVSFYKRSIYKIGIPVFIFSIFYFVFDIAMVLINHRSALSIRLLVKPIFHLLKGAPFYHMWYVYMIIWLYVLTPLIIKIKNSVSERAFFIASLIVLFFCIFSGWTSKYMFEWDIGRAICYLGYFLIGYEIRSKIGADKNNKKAILCILIGILVEVILISIRYKFASELIRDEDLVLPIVGNFNPLMGLASILFFVGFSYLDTRIDCSNISRYSFLIYLFHAGILEIMLIGYRDIFHGSGDNSLFIIPITIFVVFFISYAFAFLYSKTWDRISANYYADKTKRTDNHKL